MSKIIEEYYMNSNVPSFLIKDKLDKFSKHADITEEFEYWIVNKKYVENACVVEGYTAEMLSKKSPYLVGEAAFILLIELREDTEKAMKRIDEGFKRK